jgi:hypothetical protein
MGVLLGHYQLALAPPPPELPPPQLPDEDELELPAPPLDEPDDEPEWMRAMR